MQTFTKTVLFIGIILLITNLCHGQNFKIKGGLYGFPHCETIGNSLYSFNVGYGYLAGIEAKVFKKMTIQVNYSQTFLRYKWTHNIRFQGVTYTIRESIFMSEFRYYPNSAFDKWYFGLIAAVYTSKQEKDSIPGSWSDNSPWKDSGYKYALTGGYILKFTNKLDFEPHIAIWSDLGRYPSFDEILGYPRLQLGFCITYKF